MSREPSKLDKLPQPPNYEVGYAKPPRATQFKAGRSGNPRGRPKGAKSKRPALHEERLKEIILDEAYREITVRDGSRNVSVPMAQAVVRALAVNAAKGQHRAQRLFAEMLAATERQNKAQADAWLEAAIEYKVEWERELERRAALGIVNQREPLPHPDQVIIDLHAGTARVQGPMTKEEQKELAHWTARRGDFAEEVRSLEEEIPQTEDERIRQLMRDDVEHAKKMVAVIDRLLEKIGY